MKCDKLIKEAFEGIEFRYKLDDTLEELGNQKLSSKQLEGFLVGKGVSPKEIKQSGVLKGFENDNRVMTGKEWLERSGDQRIVSEDLGVDHYADITLGTKGLKNPSYKETGAIIKSPNTNSPSEPHFNVNNQTEGDKSLLGWRRTHTDTINGSKVTVLNELQSDWAQTERAGRGTFESNVKESSNSKIVADFPMSEVKHTQYQIVGALDEAIKNGTNKVVIPIERENELVGTAGVTKFYDSLNKKILPEIRKKLEKQGMRIKVGKEEYSESKELPGVDTLLDEMPTFARDNDYGSMDTINSKIVDYESENGLIKSLDDLDKWAKDFGYEDMFSDFLSTFGTKNSLHTLTIEEIPGNKVKWDVYALLGGLGLASQTKSEASTSTTFDITSKDKMPEKIKTMEGFRAKPYKPSESSGITIGYGYDKLEKSWKQVRGDFNEAEIDEAKARAFYTNKDVALSKEEATRLADVMWYKEGYQKLARIGLKPGELSEVIQNKIYSLAYRGDIVKNGDGYRGKIYDLIKSREFDKLDSFINSSATRAVVKKRWNNA